MDDEEDEDSVSLVYEGREIFSEVDDNMEDAQNLQINFDKSLPTTHSYLGEDLEETTGHTILEEESWMDMAIYSIPGLVLMPGQTLPLYFYNAREIAIINHVLDRDKTFGQIDCSLINERKKKRHYFGTTVEVLAVKVEDNQMKVKTIARQRFIMLDYRHDIGGVIIGKIKILPEIILGDPLDGLYSPFALKYKTKNSKKMFNYTSSFTHWPCWVYKQYDANELMKEISQELESWNNSINLPNKIANSDLNDFSQKEGQMNLVDFSYLVARSLSIDDEMKRRLLVIASPIQRLRTELFIIKKCACLCCRKCGLEMCQKEDMLEMSSEGTMGAYVNPGGHVHEILTVRKAKNILLHGLPSTESSWFPGYAWTISVCKACKQHVGWRFTVAVNNIALSPTSFWGLCRSSVTFKFNASDEKFLLNV